MPQTGASAPKTKVTEFNRHLRSIRACEDARAWADGMDAKTAWNTCERPDWLLWWAKKDGETRYNLVRCACACARTALQYVPKGEDRPRLAIEAAEQWCEYPSSENANAVYDAALAAYGAGNAYAAANDYAAANAAYAAANAAYGAIDAATDPPTRTVEVCGLIRERLAQPWSEK